MRENILVTNILVGEYDEIVEDNITVSKPKLFENQMLDLLAEMHEDKIIEPIKK